MIVGDLRMMSSNVVNMVLFDRLKTGNPVMDAILTTIILYCVSFTFQYTNNYVTTWMDALMKNATLVDHISSLCSIRRKNVVEYEGKMMLGRDRYDTTLINAYLFSDNFKSLWMYIINEVNINDTVHEIKEFNFETTYYTMHATTLKTYGTYMVVQQKRFLISKELEIYAFTRISSEVENGDDKNKCQHKIEKITIQLFSYKSNVQTIKEFVENITRAYLMSIANLRQNKRFVYSLSKSTFEKTTCELWNEVQFASTRTFANIFFKEKELVVKKLDFFMHNKDWYYEMGIPYSLGIGLYGPPGTGKTSLIKSIANYTGRHIIVISLKIIKTKQQLDNVFFEEQYNLNNPKESIGFDKKIIVFEDIDCLGDIVLDREKNKHTPKNKEDIHLNISDLLCSLKTTNDTNANELKHALQLQNEEPITLDDILNLWDGIRETPGRIMMISSNHYHELDPALRRPGRIDLAVGLGNASHHTIQEIFQHFFHEDIPGPTLENIADNFYSPAEIMNIYMNTNNDKCDFLERLLRNEHV
jgi:hypothetical protein